MRWEVFDAVATYHEARIRTLKDELLKYCQPDTLAMLQLARFFEAG